MFSRSTTRPAWRPPAIAALFGAVLALAACSTTQMASAPLWDQPGLTRHGGEIAAPAERANVWPLFYYNYGTHAMSVLWPLVAASDDAQEVIPFYTWDKTTGEVKLGVIHPFLLPSIFTRNPKEEYWRFLHVIKNGKKKAFWALPAMFKTEHGYWSLPYTQFDDGADHFKGILGPLFTTSHDATSRFNFHPFPLAWSGWGKDGSWLGGIFPLFMTIHRSEYFDSWTNVGLVLAQWQRKGENHELAYLAWLGDVKREADRTHNRLLPLWYYDAAPDRSSFYSIPYISTGQ